MKARTLGTFLSLTLLTLALGVFGGRVVQDTLTGERLTVGVQVHHPVFLPLAIKNG